MNPEHIKWADEDFAVPGSVTPASDMTLLDYFAGQALVACTVSAGLWRIVNKTADEEQPLINSIAKACYEMASAMLAERERGR